MNNPVKSYKNIHLGLFFSLAIGLFLFLFSTGQAQGQGSLELPLNSYTCCFCQGGDASQCYAKDNYPTCDAFAASINLPPSTCRGVDCNTTPSCPNYTPEVEKVIKPLKLKLNVAIPGLEAFSQGEGVEVNDTVLATFIGGIYKFFVGIAGILAVFMIVFGGMRWLFSAGNPEGINKAKEIIVGSVAGLVLAVSSYLILYTINPALVEFKGLPMVTIEQFPVIPGPTDNSVATGSAAVCPDENALIYISASGKLLVDSGASDPRLMPEALEKLNRAVDLLNPNEKLVITSAHRSFTVQKQLYDCYKAKLENSGRCTQGCTSCNAAAVPTCGAPHISGKAVDACLQVKQNGEWRSSCSYLKTQCNNGNCPSYPQLKTDQLRLQQLMKAAGFSRFRGEWWHFESTQMSTPGEPGQYGG